MVFRYPREFVDVLNILPKLLALQNWLKLYPSLSNRSDLIVVDGEKRQFGMCVKIFTSTAFRRLNVGPTRLSIILTEFEPEILG